MVTKNQKKLIRSLKQKKNRITHGLFVAEGIKVINEFLNASIVLDQLFVIKEQRSLFTKASDSCICYVTSSELSQLSFLTSPQKAIAIFKIPQPTNKLQNKGFILALDTVNDPGNLGTIIRLCDWFGIENIVCSENTVDCYNPKVVQSTMGSLTRVSIKYTNIKTYIQNTNLPVLGTFMEGKNIYKTELPKEGIIIMGNEANGISEEIKHLITKKITIPRFGETQQTESLNVATATAIILSEFKRN